MNRTELCDYVSFVICDEANALCILTPYEPIVVSLLTYKVQQNSHWTTIVREELTELLGPKNMIRNSIFKLIKVGVPQGKDEKYFINIVIMVKVSSSFKNLFQIPSIPQYSHLKWLNERDLARFYNLRLVASPILRDVFPRMEIDRPSTTLGSIHGFQECGVFIELTSEIFTKDCGAPIIDQLVEESNIRTVKRSLYVEFLKIIFPEMLMSCGHFVLVISKLGFFKQDAQHIFKSADITNRNFLTYSEFLGICAAMEPNCKNSGMSGRARAYYIFRFFNRKGNGQLVLQELKELVVMTRKARQLPIDGASIEKELKETAVSLNISSTRAISLQEFIKCCGEARVRGVTNILRNNKSIMSLIPSATTSTMNNEMLSMRKPKTAIPASVERAVKNQVQWELATHSTKVYNSGTKINIDSLLTSDICPDVDLEEASINKTTRRKSIESFSPQAICSEILLQLRILAELNLIKSGNRGNTNRDYTWGNINRKQYAQKLLNVLALAKDVLAEESRLLTLVTPLYILGDFHGNFGDLLYFERMFWPLNLEFNSASMLFLGDYVDRGWFGIEVVTYLLCNKVLHPKKFYLIRGNHEIRDVQQMYSFYSECITKFGEAMGKSLWDAVNVCFDYMPLAAIIENRIFCCHGGIPPPWLAPSVSAINQIPKPLPDPSVTSVLAWDLLWNDPIKDQDITKEIGIEMAANYGFASNPKRGTAHVFNKTATAKFLAINDFTHIIRAHEMASAGFAVLHKGKVISIFSSSRYNDGNNDAACILLDDYKMQIFRLNSNHFNS